MRSSAAAVLLAALLLFNACKTPTTSQNNPASRVELNVSAAVSLKNAFQEIGRLYEARNNVKVNFNFGASGALQKQIEASAPVDVFASAGAKQMDELAARRLVETETRRDFARNSLVLVAPSDAARSINSFADLAGAQLQRLAVGNPKTVPAGQYTEQLLTNLKLLPALQPRLIFGEDVRQVLDYVARSEVDAGIVYATDVEVAKARVRVVERAREDLHDPILYPIAVIKESSHKEEARRFVELVLSPEGQSILSRYGFLSAGAQK